MKSLKFLSLAVMLLLAFALTGCEPRIVGPLLTSEASRSIEVTGSGSVVGEPDMATLNLGVSVEKETVAEAREAAAVAMTAVIETLKANGIAETDIQTERFNIYPQYDYANNERTLRGYRVENAVAAKVRELDSLSQIIDDASAAGGDVIFVNAIQFMIEDSTPMQTQARSLAVQNATAKAETLAEAGGVTLGLPITITETSYAVPPPVAYFPEAEAAFDDAARSSTPIEAGELTVTVNVTVTYEIK